MDRIEDFLTWLRVNNYHVGKLSYYSAGQFDKETVTNFQEANLDKLLKHYKVDKGYL